MELNKNVKGAIIVLVVAIIAYLIYKFAFKKSPEEQKIDNFNDAKKFLGDNTINSTDTLFVVEFNNGKNQATFFNNNRFFVYEKSKGLKNATIMGTYTDGGKKLYVDGGKVIKGKSVVDNLSKTL